MENGTDTPTPDSLVALAESGDGSQARAALERLEGASDEQRRECLRTLRSLADERPAAVAEFVPALERFLSDDDRSVRLATAKAFVPVAAAQPAAVVPTVSTLADRLADEPGTDIYGGFGELLEAFVRADRNDLAERLEDRR